jgi:hypothetical protein
MTKNNNKKKSSFSGLNLKPEEDERLINLLIEKDIKYKQLVRALIRQWVAEGGEGVLKYSKK